MDFWWVLFALALLKVASSCIENNGGCEHSCRLVNNVIKCNCDSLGTLNADLKTCSYRQALFLTQGHHIQSYLPNKEERGYLYNGNATVKYEALAQNYANRTIFHVTTDYFGYELGMLYLPRYRYVRLDTSSIRITALAFEKSSNTLYYAQSDGNIKTIQDVYKKRQIEILMKVTQPTSIEIESCFGYLFIADSGSQSIIRYNTRQNVSLTIVERLSFPNAVTADKFTEKLFWADATTDSIEMVNYDGTCRQLIKKFNNIHPVDFLFHNGLLYWINQNDSDHRIYVTNIKSRRTDPFTSQLTLKPVSLVFFGNENEGQWSDWIDVNSCPSNCTGTIQRKRICQNPYSSNYTESCVKTNCTRTLRCVTNGSLQSVETRIFECIYPCTGNCSVNNGGCEDLCYMVNNFVRCSCKPFGTLNADLKTCSYHQAFYFSQGHVIQAYFRNKSALNYINDELTSVKYTALAQDYTNKTIYFCSNSPNGTELYMWYLPRFQFTVIYTTNMSITALSFETPSKALYYAKSDGYIEVFQDVYKKRLKSILLKVARPTAIEIESCFGYLFIADSGSRSIIRYNTRQNVSLTIVERLSFPTAVTADKLTEKLFWADATTDSIEMVNYDGTCRQLIKKFDNIHPVDLLFHNGLLYWINQDDSDHRIYVTNIKSRRTDPFTSQLTLKPVSLVFFGNENEEQGQWSDWIDVTSCPSNCTGTIQRKRICQNPLLSSYPKGCVKTNCTRTFQCFTNGSLQSFQTRNFECVYPCTGNCSVKNGGCEDLCYMVNNFVRCSCKPFGTLNADLKTCSYHQAFYFSQGHVIQAYFRNKSALNYINDELTSVKYTALAQDYTNKTIFYCSNSPNGTELYMWYLPRFQFTVIYTTNMSITGLSFETSSKALYYAKSDGYIEVFQDLYRKRQKHILLKVARPTAIEIESCFGIEMVNYDGTCRQLIKKINNIYPVDLLFHNGLLYLVNQDDRDHRIYITNITSRYTSAFTSKLPLKPVSIVFFGNESNERGQWSDWIDVTSCSFDCKGTIQKRRICQNPFSRNYEKRCVQTKCKRTIQCVTNGYLQSIETRSFQCVYPCKVNGAWSAWRYDGTCSTTCGNGTRTRNRDCDNPSPTNGGFQCTGHSTEKEICNLHSCPASTNNSSEVSMTLIVGVGGGLILILILLLAVLAFVCKKTNKKPKRDEMQMQHPTPPAVLEKHGCTTPSRNMEAQRPAEVFYYEDQAHKI